MSKLKRSRLLLLSLLFLFIYNPPIFSFNILHLVSFFSYAVFIVNPKYRKLLFCFMKTRVSMVFFLFGFFSILLLFTTILFTSRNFLYLYNIIIIFIEVFPVTVLFSIFLKINKFRKNDILVLLLDVGLMQAFIAIIMFLSPSFKSTILSLFYDHYNEFPTMSYWVKYRVFGLSAGMMFAMPVTQGFLASIAFLAGLKVSAKYYWYIPILLFSAVVNGRIGIIVFFVNVVIVVFLNTTKWRVIHIPKILLLSLILVILVPQLLFLIESKSEIMFKWLVDGYYETVKFFKGESTGYYRALSTMFFFPELETILFGSGKDYFFQKYQSNSTDIGYINDLFLGGIFYTILLYGSILIYLFKSKNKKNGYHNYITYMSVTIMLVANIKGYAFRQNEFLNLFIFIATVSLLYNNLEISSTNKK